ncbi:MAG TPA: glycosyltransferase [Verrucomicrobiae bacterium]|nr:glycosyltransferase [Verrucomicrobiae bacterium]
MKIALIQDWLTGFAGGEQVLLALHKMYPDAPIYTSLYNPEKAPQFADATVIPSYLQSIPVLNKRDKLAIPLMPAAFESFDLKGFDVILSVGGGLSKGVITHPGQRHISYCHTPIRYIWRLGGDNRNTGKWDSWLREQAMHKLRLWDVVSAERVDTFIANSPTVQGRIAKIYRQDSLVVAPPVDIDRFSLSTESDDYFLTVGRMVAYKRGDLVIEACKAAKKPLKIVGGGPEEARFRKLAEGAPWIEFTGRVSDEELQKLYGRAKAFIFASEEDAGIVPVEAMACGKPVIAYGKGGVADVVVEGVHGTFFPEQTKESLVEALNRFDDLQFDATIIRKHAEGYRLSVFQDKIRKIIEHA